MEKEFKYRGISLAYATFGSGPNVMLTFHGFGQSKQFFKPFEKVFGKDYTLYHFDLFFHGNSQWNQNQELLTKEFWRDIISSFLKEKQIDRFSLVGYSLGGKFVMAILECLPERIDRIILIAPDGIKTSYWYSLATYPPWARTLFKRSVANHLIFLRFASLIRGLRLVDKGLMKFAKTQMDTEEKRRRVYYSWVVFRLMKFDLKKIARLINQNDIQLQLFLGKYDKMITKRNVFMLLKHLKSYHLEILETGHNKLISEVAHFLEMKNKKDNG